MKNNFIAGLSGFIFAIGLGLSGMTQPQKVIGFLDIFGTWDPSLLFVMAGAILFHFVTYKFVTKRQTPLLSPDWHIPKNKNISKSLIAGSFMFGIGWGIAGYCPGPAMTSLSSLSIKPLIFVMSMLIGMYIFKFLDKKIQFKR